MGFKEDLQRIAGTGKSCTLFTLFGHGTGTVEQCDGETFTFHMANGNVVRMYCEDVVGFVD